MAHQFLNLAEIADMFKRRLLSVETMKVFHDRVRCAAYPDAQKVKEERQKIETAWPAFAENFALCRAPSFLWDPLRASGPPVLSEATNLEKWSYEGHTWGSKQKDRLQYVLSRMNHHIHPLVDASTGERRPLPACQPTNNRKNAQADSRCSRR